MKRLLIGLILAVMTAAIGFGLWFGSRGSSAVVTARWVSRNLDSANSLHVQSDHGDFMLSVLNNEWEAQVVGKTWNVVAKVLPEKVDGYLESLATLVPHRSVGGVDAARLSGYGLDTPDYSIVIAFGNDEKNPLTIKMVSDGAGTVYGWQSDRPGLVYEFKEVDLAQLDIPATDFFDKRVFWFNEEEVSSIQLVQPFGSSWLVEKQAEGYFFSLPGYLKGKPASDSALKLYIHSLALLRANNMVMEPVSTDTILPALTIKVWASKTKEPALVEFFAMKDEPGKYVGRSSRLTVPFTMDAQSVAQLIKSAFDVQGRAIVKVDIGKVNRLIVVHGGTRYDVLRGETGWRVAESKKDLPGIDMSLWRFSELQFEALPLNTLPKTAVQLMYCELLDKDSSELAELTFYADPKLPQGQCWMKNGGGMYYPVSSRLLKDLQGMFPARANAVEQNTPLQ